MFARRSTISLLALLACAVLVSVAAGASGAAIPSIVSAPVISGTPAVGQTLTAGHGAWDGARPLSFAYQWRRCNSSGVSCVDIAGATTNSYEVTSADAGASLRVRVTATNSAGSVAAGSAASTLVAGTPPPPTTTAATTTTTSAPPPSPATCCPSGQGAVDVSELSLPTRLLISQFSATPQVLSSGTTAFTLRVEVTDTCGQVVSGALVYVTATPYNQFSIPPEATTDGSGWATLAMSRLAGFPVSPKQELLALFIRARKSGENILAGISARELVSVRVNLH